VGDGVLRFAPELAAAGVSAPDARSSLHRISGVALCRLGVDADATQRDALLPDYRRDPDAKPPRLPST
jgi:tRNA threonylcarbamoyladenosine biosynthesis protein TsaB